MADPRTPLFELLRPHLKQGWNAPGLIASFSRELDLLGAAKDIEKLPDVPLLPAALPLSFAQAAIDADLLCMAFPANTRAGLLPWVDATRNAAVRWGIDTFREVASFLANVNVESRGLTVLEENMNYSARRLAEVWPNRFAVNSKAKPLVPNALAQSLAGHPQKLANHVYANRMGNGPPESGDGWRHRGFGPKQLTGKDNQSASAAAVGMPLSDVPAYVRTPEGGMMSAGWFWKANDLDSKAATPGLADDRRAVQGGSVGLPAVERTFNLIIDELLERERKAA